MGQELKSVGIIARGLTKGGVTRVIVNIFRELERQDQVRVHVFTDREDFKEKFKQLDVVYVKKSNKLFWDYFRCLSVLKKYEMDAIVYPKNIIPFTHAFLRARKVNIIHDLAYFDKDLKEYKLFDTFYMRLLMGVSCRISDRVLAVSENTSKDVEKILGIRPDKIAVIPWAVEMAFQKILDENVLMAVRGKYDITEPFLFYCGSLSPRKNILRVLKAFEAIKATIPHMFYISCGQSWKDAEVRKFIDSRLSDRVKLLPFLSNEELVVMYSMADLYLYPSLYEGFGLPILEAQACGCPVLTSNVTSCPEVAGRGAHIVDPYSVEQISRGMVKIVTDRGYREELVSAGHENVKKYSWAKTARTLLRNIA